VLFIHDGSISHRVIEDLNQQCGQGYDSDNSGYLENYFPDVPTPVALRKIVLEKSSILKGVVDTVWWKFL
jgi:hypothetical protein